MTGKRSTILFACVHNAGRSQMAAAFARALARGSVTILSGGSEPARAINPAAAEAMAEAGLDIGAERPRLLLDGDVAEADVVVMMGCGESCPFYPGKRYLEWEIEDPVGKPIEAVRRIRDDIRARVEALLREIEPAPGDSG